MPLERLTDHGCFYDSGHVAFVLRAAWRDLRDALNAKEYLEPDSIFEFTSAKARIEELVDTDYLGESDPAEDKYSIGNSEEEVEYRRWCLRHRLFLNPLNDVCPHSIAARDVLLPPPIVLPIRTPPSLIGFFNQIKQEYVTARLMCFEGSASKNVHFSDRDVFLLDTLDYTDSCLAVERCKTAFKTAYSILDKIAYLLNIYFRLGTPSRDVSFRTIWYSRGTHDHSIHPVFAETKNWCLRGLFWIAKDLFEDRKDYRKALAPDARDLWQLRNALEHRYVKVHSPIWNEAIARESRRLDPLAVSIRRDDLVNRSLRMISIARSAIMTLAFAIHIEEVHRRLAAPTETKVAPMPVMHVPDEWKR